MAVYSTLRYAMDDDRDILKWRKVNKLVYPKLASYRAGIQHSWTNNKAEEDHFETGYSWGNHVLA